MRRNVGILGMVVAATSAFRVVSLLSQTPAPATPSPQALPLSVAICDASDPEEGPWKAAVRVFKGRFVPTANVPKPSIEFLFASVADPEQTHLSLNFDRALESLMWAIEDDGYAFESYWLPWTLVAEKSFPAFSDQQCIKKQKESRRKQPGLLVFRKSPPEKSSPEHFLLVWVVGETPTSGIDNTMLSNAIDYSRTIDPGLQTFRLLGPNFSGSLGPLAHQIENFASKIPGAHFYVVSGAATNLKAIKQFSTYLTNGQRNLATFELSIENDQRATTLFFKFVRSELIWPLIAPLGYGETAILSEDETVYGDLGLALTPDERHNWMMLRYPREIGRLRNSYHEPSSPLPSTPGQSPNEGVSFTMRDSLANPFDSPPDSIAEFSGEQSPASQQAVLHTISETLRREHASYTGIVATDVLDSLFLAHFLRTTDPDTRVFTIDSDLLFLREAETEPLDGMLAVTTYPLFSRNQHWTEAELRPDHMPRRVQFASRYAEGIYNACRRLLLPKRAAADSSQRGAGDGGGSAVEPDAFLEYERPSDPSHEKPPLWLTVVGRDGYWPVALLDEAKGIGNDQSTITDFTDSVRSDPSRPSEKFHPEEPSRGWRLLFSCACLFCFAHVFYMFNILNWNEHQEQKEAVSKSRLARCIQALHHLFNVYPDDHRPSVEECPFLLTATLSLFSSLLLFSFPLFPFLAYRRYAVYFVVATICLSCLFVIAALLMIRWLSGPPPPNAGNPPADADKIEAREESTARGVHDGPKGKIYLRVVILAWVLSIPFLAGWIYLIVRTDYKTGEFFAYRALYLSNGVSPEIPIVLLAVVFYGWAWVHLYREADVRVRRQVRPSPDNPKDQPWPDEIWKPIRLTDQSIEDIVSSDISIPALAFLCLWFLVLFPPESLRTFEFYLYDILYWSVLTGVYWCIALVVVQFILVWRQLRKLLDALERHPVRHAFSRLNKEISWIPLVSSNPARSLMVTTRSLDCLKAMHALTLALGQPDPAIERVVSMPSFETMLHKLSCGQDFNEEYREFQHQLDGLIRHIIFQLAPEWLRGHSESVTNELVHRNKAELLDERGKLTMLREEFLALRLLLYIRYVLRQLRNWLGFIIAGFVISVISMNSYPFQGHRWIGLASVITLLAIGTAVAMVFAEMDRDPLLSRITDTKANEVGSTFFFRLARFGALPLLTVLAAQFPFINRILFFWIKPAFDALK